MFGFVFFLLLAALSLNGCGDQTGGSAGMGGDGGTSGSGGMGGVFPCTEQGIRDAIAAGGGPYTFDCGTEPVVTTETIVINNDVILDGEGELTVDGNQSHCVFQVETGVEVELRGATVTRGFSGGPGGGIFNSGTLTLTNSTVSENTVRGLSRGHGGGIENDNNGSLTLTNSTVSGNTASGCGGGIDNNGSLTLTNSTVSGNTAGLDDESSCAGGGIYNDRGAVTLTNSTVSGNTASVISEGGGIYNDRGAVTLTNSTVSGNTASGSAGGIYNGDTLTLTSSTVSGNTALESGGGIVNFGAVTLTNSTVSGNTAGLGGGIYNDSDTLTLTLTNSLVNGDCFGNIVSNGYNIESPANTCGFDQPTDQPNVTEEELDLGPLADNGGPTMTHALGPGSVAIDQIPTVDCVDADDKPLTEDQRGKTRPQGPTCDVGAFELEPQ